jgi:cation:H+ antiporter
VSSLVALLLLALGVGLVIAGAEVLLDGLLASAARFGVSAFAITVAISGFELENLAAGIAANAAGLPGAAAGTFLGGTTFLALGVSGLAALIAPISARLPDAALAWTAVGPLPLVALGLDGTLTRLDGAVLVLWFAVALVGLMRTGRALLEPEEAERRRHPLAWLLGGLVVLTAGGALLAEGIRGVVDRLGVSQTVLGNTWSRRASRRRRWRGSRRPAAVAAASWASATSPARSSTSPPSTPA